MELNQKIPIDVVHLLPVLDRKLMELLLSLSAEEWQKQTIAKLWNVKDLVAHLLDGNIRILSILRDHYIGEEPNFNSYNGLVDFLNRMNADWVKAMKRVSPQTLIFLHEMTGPPFYEYFKTLDPFGKSPFAVSWAGETESANWMEIAREYTEKWLHQQQIRDAVGKPGLMTRDLFYPFIDIFMLALPHTYRKTTAAEGTMIKLTVTTDIGGSWYLIRGQDKWSLSKNGPGITAAEIEICPDKAWKLFSKSLRADEVKDEVKIYGDQTLAVTALTMISVMA